MKKPHTKRFAVPPADALFLTRREAAALLRVNIQLIDEMIRHEKLPAYRPVGRRILIRREELLRVVAESPVWEVPRGER
jgi:excisionase family DNA binding protein